MIAETAETVNWLKPIWAKLDGLIVTIGEVGSDSTHVARFDTIEQAQAFFDLISRLTL